MVGGDIRHFHPTTEPTTTKNMTLDNNTMVQKQPSQARLRSIAHANAKAQNAQLDSMPMKQNAKTDVRAQGPPLDFGGGHDRGGSGEFDLNPHGGIANTLAAARA